MLDGDAQRAELAALMQKVSGAASLPPNDLQPEHFIDLPSMDPVRVIVRVYVVKVRSLALVAIA